MPARDNEKQFRRLMEEKFGDKCLKGEQQYTLSQDGFPTASISVDDAIYINGRLVLIEIDSGNMAKLLAGQYALINGMYDGDKSKTLFLVVHYYRDKNSGTLYNRERTLNNLNAIKSFNPMEDWLPFNAFNYEEFETILESSGSLDIFVKNVWPERPRTYGTPTLISATSAFGVPMGHPLWV